MLFKKIWEIFFYKLIKMGSYMSNKSLSYKSLPDINSYIQQFSSWVALKF